MKGCNVKLMIAMFVGLFSILNGNLWAEEINIDMKSDPNGLVIEKSLSVTPDEEGTLKTYKLTLPEYTKVLYFRGAWWPYGGNNVFGKSIDEIGGSGGGKGGIFMVLQLTDGRYLAVLPLAGDQAYAYLVPGRGSNKKDCSIWLSTFGTASVKGDFPIVCWATSDSPYEASSKVWLEACEVPQIKGNMKPRYQKEYPEIFKYLGWCSWEEYRTNITSDRMVAEMEGLQAAPIPVRWFLVDHGHFSKTTLGPDEEKFPNGYTPLTDLRDLKSDRGIKWVGMWHALLGVRSGVERGNPPAIKDVMMDIQNGNSMPKPDIESITTFMKYLYSHSKRDKIDFIKIDFCGPVLPYYAGSDKKTVIAGFPKTTENAVPNPAEAAINFSRIYQETSAEFKALMNCNWHTPPFVFNSMDSNVGRCSGDYRKSNLRSAKTHIFGSYNTILWLGQTVWGDHDMFHSSDEFAGRMMAITKAMSGGPVYLSDSHDHLLAENIRPLCYENGLIIRPLAPASPFEEDLFLNIEDEKLHRVMAPLPNKSAAFAVYNYLGDKEQDLVELSGTISPDHYRDVSGMIQPYPGKWEMPKEGLVLYDDETKTAEKFDKEYKITIKGFGDRFFQVSPIQNGWSVIGRTDKFLSAATVEILSCSDNELKIKLAETGPFAIWLTEGTPTAFGITFADKGNGLFVADLPVEAVPMEVVINK